MHEQVRGTALPPALTLAYLGDARHSLYVRHMLVRRGVTQPGELNRLSLNYVTAEAQAAAYTHVAPLLLEDEQQTFRRAFNSPHLKRPRHGTNADYRTATGFEAVIGMLTFLGDEERLTALLDTIYKEMEL